MDFERSKQRRHRAKLPSESGCRYDSRASPWRIDFKQKYTTGDLSGAGIRFCELYFLAGSVGGNITADAFSVVAGFAAGAATGASAIFSSCMSMPWLRTMMEMRRLDGLVGSSFSSRR